MARNWNPLCRLANAADLWQSGGLGGVWRRLMRSFWATKRYVVVVRAIDDAPAPEESPDVTFRLASPSDIEWMSLDMPQMKGHAAELLRQQFEHDGDLTIVGTPKDEPRRVVFAVWLSHEDFALNLLGDHRRPGDVSSRRGWVPESHRRLGVAKRGFVLMHHVARQAGIPRIWAFIPEANAASRRLYEKHGYTDFGRIRLKMRFGRRFARVRLGNEGRWQTVPVPREHYNL